MAGVIATIPKFQFSANGVPMVGGTLETYIAGSTTPATTWQDSDLTIANTNPISLDARGECVLWLDPAVVYKFVLKNAQGVIQWTQDNISNPAALRLSLAASTGASLVGFDKPGPLQTVQQQLDMLYFGIANVRDTKFSGGAKCDGTTDDTAAIQAACSASRYVFFPSNGTNYYKTTSAITLLGGAHLIGAGQTQTILGAWGSDAFLINGANGDHVTIEGMELRGYTGAGVIDAKANAGIKAFGTNANHVNYLKIKSCFLRGWLYGVDWQYTWSSTLDDVDTLNCTNGLRLFGQSVNNAVVKSRLIANGGNASILTAKDVDIKGEGLMVTASLLASGNFGVSSDGFLSMNFVGCTVDLIADKAFDLTNVPALMISACWIYAANYGVNFNTLGTAVDQGASLTGNYITVTASGGKAVYIGGNNQGVSVTGGELICGANGRLVHVDGSGVAVTGVRGINSGTNPSVFFNGADCLSRNNTGSMVVQWNVGVPSQGGVAVATAAFAGATGAQSLANGCSVARTGVGAYTVTFTYPLASANYIPIITMDRGGNGAMGYAVTSITAASFSFTCTNAAATANDPGTVWLAVFN